VQGQGCGSQRAISEERPMPQTTTVTQHTVRLVRIVGIPLKRK